jgi:transcriptional regulator with XRE-family HTH domain
MNCVGNKGHVFMIKHVVAQGCEPDTHGRPVWKRVGRRLLARRIELGLSIDQLADELVIAPSAYESYEQGAAQAPALLLAQIANLFAVPVHWFFLDALAHWEVDDAAPDDVPRSYRVATTEQRTRFLAEAFCRLDLEGQQLLLAIVAALSQRDIPRAGSSTP